MTPLLIALFLLFDTPGEWIQLPADRWTISTATPSSNSASFHHSYNNTVAATDIIYRSLPNIMPQEHNITWRFLLRHGYNPSGSNKWGFVLMADTSAAEWRSGGAYRAYVIGVNQGSNTDDTLSLYAVRNNTYTNIRKTNINWEKDIKTTGTGAVEVTRTAEGLWTIRATTTGDLNQLDTVAAPAKHATYSTAHFSGLIYTYTAAADQLLWCENISMEIVPVEPAEPLPPPYTPTFGDIVFNEIMAKADPSGGLPELQYIELYNRSKEEIKLEGWKINYNNTMGNISAITLPAQSYLILCSSAAVPVMKDYGRATAVTNIALLTKSGKTLLLKNAQGEIMARTMYSDKWINSENQRVGGWSLEKIDPNNLSEEQGNWSVSVAQYGGTPGVENSVCAKKPDEQAPYLTTLKIVDDKTLLLEVNEWFIIHQALNTASYKVNNGVGHPSEISYDSNSPLQLQLHFDTEFNHEQVYELNFQAPFSDMAGNTPDMRVYPFAQLTPPQQGELVINEILFHPFAGGADFVELYNLSDKIFDLSHILLAHRNKLGEVASLVSCPVQYYLYPRNYAVFTTSFDAVNNFYSLPFPEKIIELTSLPSWPNAEGCVVLMNSDKHIIDEFSYTEKMHSVFLTALEGISMERVNPAVSATEKSNWQSAAHDAGGATPGYRNSQFDEQKKRGDAPFSLSTEAFSPNGDGRHDVLYLDYNLQESGYMAGITVYDMQGRAVRTLENSTLLGRQGRLAWDGADDAGKGLLSGIFILFISLYDVHGDVQTFKLPCVITL